MMPGLEGTAFGRYRLQRRLGHGGMAEVYLANDERMHREVAIKVVSSSHAEFAERFSREAQAMGNLHHDHLLPAYDYGEQEPWHYLVMPYIEHGTLNDLLQKGSLSLEYAGELLQQLASALQYAHGQGLIHRDIKPANILLRDDHYTYLADFGLARALAGSDLTLTGTLLGTPEYMAPELAESPASQSSDTYALAVVLYQMLSGRVPFHGETPVSTFWKHLREYPQAPSQFNPRLSPAVDHVVMRALAKDPRQRYATPLALSQAYQEAIHAVTAEEMPSLEVLEEAPPHMASADPVQPEGSLQTPVLPVHPEKLFLRAVDPPSPEVRRAHPPITPVPRQEPDYTTARRQPGNPRTPSTPRLARSRRGRNSQVLIGVIMGLVFLLVVTGILAALTISMRQQGAGMATATARAGATGTLVVGQTAQAHATQQAATAIAVTATAQAVADQHKKEAAASALTNGTPLLSDPLHSSSPNAWPDDGTACSFNDNGYVVTARNADTLQPCLSTNLHYTNAAFQVNVTLLTSADAGLIFRASSDASQFYDFEITSQGQFYVRYRANGAYTSLIRDTSSSAIQGSGGKNTLLVIANGTDLQFFINGTFVGEVLDRTFAGGQLGLVAGTLSASNSGSANFTNLRVYSVG